MSSDRETTLREALERICVDDWGPNGGRIIKGNAEIADREAATFYRGYNAGIEGQFKKTLEIAQKALASTPPASVPVEPSGWQDISTAPKDGTRIDVWLGDGDAEDIEFYCAKGSRRSTDWHWKSGRFRPAMGLQIPVVTVRPTHWMPLPSPPLSLSEDT